MGALQYGHVLLLARHRLRQCEWNTCPHGVTLPTCITSRHTGHWGPTLLSSSCSSELTRKESSWLP